MQFMLMLATLTPVYCQRITQCAWLSYININIIASHKCKKKVILTENRSENNSTQLV